MFGSLESPVASRPVGKVLNIVQTLLTVPVIGVARFTHGTLVAETNVGF